MRRGPNYDLEALIAIDYEDWLRASRGPVVTSLAPNGRVNGDMSDNVTPIFRTEPDLTDEEAERDERQSQILDVDEAFGNMLRSTTEAVLCVGEAMVAYRRGFIESASAALQCKCAVDEVEDALHVLVNSLLADGDGPGSGGPGGGPDSGESLPLTGTGW